MVRKGFPERTGIILLRSESKAVRGEVRLGWELTGQWFWLRNAGLGLGRSQPHQSTRDVTEA